MMTPNTTSSSRFDNLSDFLMYQYLEKTIVFKTTFCQNELQICPGVKLFSSLFPLVICFNGLYFLYTCIIYSFYVYSIIRNKNTFNQDLIIVFLIFQIASFFFGLVDGEQYLNSDSLLFCLYKKFKDFTFNQGVKPNPNRIRKLVLPVIIFQTRTGTEPEKKFGEPKSKLNPKKY